MIRANAAIQGTDSSRNSDLGCPRIRSSMDIARIRKAGEVVASALDAASAACMPGVKTEDLDQIAAEVISASGADPLFLGHAGPTGEFPASTCISVEDEITHGVPGDRVLESGEIVTIDCGVRLDGWCADAAVTVPVGEVCPERRELIETNESLLWLAIRMIRPGRRWSEIAEALQNAALDSDFGVVEEFTGHGIGQQLHEAPAIPSVLTQGLLGRGDFTLRPGMVLAIEPMLVLGGAALRGDGTAAGVPTYLGSDGWTVSTLLGDPASHFEHTVAVTRNGAEVLTAVDSRLNAPQGAQIPGFSWESGI